MLVDITNLNYIDVDFLFHENWKVCDLLRDIPAESVFECLKVLKNETGITFGHDIGARV